MDEEQQPTLVPSDLDQATHAELLALYRESSEAILFAKTRQQKTVVGTILFFVGLIVVATLVPRDDDIIRAVVFISFVLSSGAISMLIIYQTWLHSEGQKQHSIGTHFSSLFQSTRNIRSRFEVKTHQYFLLIFRIVTIVMGNIIVAFYLSSFYR